MILLSSVGRIKKDVVQILGLEELESGITQTMTVLRTGGIVVMQVFTEIEIKE